MGVSLLLKSNCRIYELHKDVEEMWVSFIPVFHNINVNRVEQGIIVNTYKILLCGFTMRVGKELTLWIVRLK